MNDLLLAKNLDELMKKKRLTLSALSRSSGINKSTLHNYLNGTAPSGLETIRRLSKFFNISIPELMYGDCSGEIRFVIEGRMEGVYELKIVKVSS